MLCFDRGEIVLKLGKKHAFLATGNYKIGRAGVNEPPSIGFTVRPSGRHRHFRQWETRQFMVADSMRCFLVEKRESAIKSGITTRPTAELPPGEVTIRVQYSSLNYKDALAAKGHPGVAPNLPHVPGIDAVGKVALSSDSRFVPGQIVLATSYEIGATRWGAYAEYLRVPGDWTIPLARGLSPRESMILGTAGLTAAMCVEALQDRGVSPAAGEVLVTGASGGVGTLAVSILAQLGYHVVSVSGKPAARDLLTRLGARRIISREDVIDTSTRPLLKSAWAAAIDTVGGVTLATILRSLKPGGVVTACGLVGGAELPLTVYPFILRGAQLVGIDSATYPREKRIALWNKLAGPWKPPLLDELASEITLEQLPEKISAILAGQIIGRVLVRVGQTPNEGKAPCRDL
jgi:putative YhdH/YhfP family quinone oxidoreductase